MIQLEIINKNETSSLLYRAYSNIVRREIETKQQCNARVATEKMLASWDMHNKPTPTTKQVIQICKPRHRVSHMGRR